MLLRFRNIRILQCSHVSRLTELPQGCAELPLACCCRWFSLTTISNSSQQTDFNQHVNNKFMQKLLNKKGAKGKKKWYEPYLADGADPVGKKLSGKQKGGERAVLSAKGRQLSHILYERITEILDSGDLSEELLKKQVFISSVKIHHSFKGVNVHWDADRKDAEEVEKMLFAVSRKLRSQLISYHVLGKIPPITFVKERGHSASDVLSLLEQADFGPDYTPGVDALPVDARGDDSFHGDIVKDAVRVKRRSEKTAVTAETADKISERSNLGDDGVPESEETSEVFLRQKVKDYFKSEQLSYEASVYALPQEVLMNKLVAKKKGQKIVTEDVVMDFSKKMSDSDLVRKKIDADKLSKMSARLEKRRLLTGYDEDGY